MQYHAVAYSPWNVNAGQMNREADRRRQALTRFMEAHKLKRGTLARRADISPNIIYNFFKGKSGYLSQPTLERIAETFNVPISAITGETIAEQRHSLERGLREPGGGFSATGSDGISLPAELTTIEVTGTIIGGSVWSETIFVEPEKKEFISFNMPAIYHGKVFALRVQGLPAGSLLPAGSILGCVAAKDYLQQIRSGDIVVMVRRNQTGLFQTSLRQYAIEGSRHWLTTYTGTTKASEKLELLSPLDEPMAMGFQDFFIHAVVLAYAADLPAMRR